MKDEPDIVKELREVEKLEDLQSKVQNAYEKLEVVEEPSQEDIPDKSIGFVEDDVEKKQEGANINNEKLPWKSEEKWRLLLENLPNIVLLVDRDGIIQYINHTVPGFTPDQVIGKNHIEFISPEYHDMVKEAVEQVFQTGNIGDYEIKGAGPKGSISWYASRIGPIKIDGQVAAVSIITTDVTEKKQTEFKLGERLKEFRCLYDVTNSIRSEKTLEELLGETTGYIREAWQYPEITRCKIIFDGKEYRTGKFEETKFKQTADIAVNGKNRGIIEVYYVKEMPESDEGPFLKEERELLDEIASYLGMHVGKKELERETHKAAEEWKTTFDSISDLVSMQDKDCKVLNANKAYLDTFNLSREELIGKHCYEIVHGTKEPFPGCPHLQALKTKKSVTAEFFEPHLGIFLEVSTSPVFDENGEVVGTTHIVKNITKRKKAEREIKYLKEYNENILESNPNPIIVVKGNQIEYVNNSFISAFGKTKNDYISKELIEAIPVEVASIFEELLQDYDKIKELEVKDKSFSVSSFVVKKAEEEEEEEERIGLILQDITERKKAEEKIRENEEKIRNILESSPDSIAVTDLEGNITECNEATLKLHGFSSKEEVIGKSAFMFFPEKERERATANLKKALEGSIKNIEYTLLKKDGKEFPAELSASVIKDPSGKPVAFVAITKDITERKKAQNTLKESEEKYRSLFESMLNGFAYCKILVDEDNQPIDFVHLEVNNVWERLIGLKKEDVIGKKVTEVIPGIKASETDLISIYGEVALTGKATRFDLYFEPLDKWFTISVYSPHKSYFVTVFEDITERKKAEEKLKIAHEKLERKVDELEQYKRVTVGREIKMTELKNRINELEDKSREYEYVDMPKNWCKK